jgi:hypothetical protein
LNLCFSAGRGISVNDVGIGEKRRERRLGEAKKDLRWRVGGARGV